MQSCHTRTPSLRVSQSLLAGGICLAGTLRSSPRGSINITCPSSRFHTSTVPHRACFPPQCGHGTGIGKMLGLVMADATIRRTGATRPPEGGRGRVEPLSLSSVGVEIGVESAGECPTGGPPAISVTRCAVHVGGSRRRSLGVAFPNQQLKRGLGVRDAQVAVSCRCRAGSRAVPCHDWRGDRRPFGRGTEAVGAGAPAGPGATASLDPPPIRQVDECPVGRSVAPALPCLATSVAAGPLVCERPRHRPMIGVVEPGLVVWLVGGANRRVDRMVGAGNHVSSLSHLTRRGPSPRGRGNPKLVGDMAFVVQSQPRSAWRRTWPGGA